MDWKLVCFMCGLCMSVANGASVMSVDLGTAWMKVAVVSPGVPMEIALNEESKRKSPVAVGFRGTERVFGEEAVGLAVRYPHHSYRYLLDLLGKQVDNPVVTLYQRRFPHHHLVPHPTRKTVLFQNATIEEHLSVEELVAMLLGKAKEYASASADTVVKDTVLTVPGYFNQAERKAIISAAKMAGLNVLQLINDYTAVALNYGIFRVKEFNETAQYVMFYDMGAYSTTVAVVSFQMVKVKDQGRVETHPQLSVLGVGYERHLGGMEMTFRLRDYLAKEFNDMKKTTKDVFQQPKALEKLFKEAERLKIVLSVNTEFYAQVENLMDDIDFKLLVTRETFVKLCSDLFDLVGEPVRKALKVSHLTMDSISQVVLSGAGTRVPSVQDRLSAAVGMELSKNLNTDEAAVMGAVYKAADLSAGFKVKKFITKDAVLFPIHVMFERSDVDKVLATGKSKQTTRTLFGLMNPYPQKKVLTFNKHHGDFEFHVHYGDLEHYHLDDIRSLGPTKLHTIKLEGVSDAIVKHQGPDVDSKGIKAHFSMDESGILHMTGVEYVVEKLIKNSDTGDQSAFSKISNTISKLFQAADDEEKHPDSDAKIPNKTASEAGTGNETTAKPVEPQPGEEAKGKIDEASASDSDAMSKDKAKPPVLEAKNVTIKEPIKAHVQILHVQDVDQKQFEESVKKIRDLNEHDLKKIRKDKALNALESLVIDLKEKLADDEYASFMNSNEVEEINKLQKEYTEWLDEDAYDSNAETLEEKLTALRNWVEPIEERRMLHRDLPAIFQQLDIELASKKNLIVKLGEPSPIADKSPIIVDGDVDVLYKLLNETLEMKDGLQKRYENTAKHETPPNLYSLREKITTINRQMELTLKKHSIFMRKIEAEMLKKQKSEKEAEADDSPDSNKKSGKSKSKKKSKRTSKENEKPVQESVSEEDESRKEGQQEDEKTTSGANSTAEHVEDENQENQEKRHTEL